MKCISNFDNFLSIESITWNSYFLKRILFVFEEPIYVFRYSFHRIFRIKSHTTMRENNIFRSMLEVVTCSVSIREKYSKLRIMFSPFSIYLIHFSHYFFRVIYQCCWYHSEFMCIGSFRICTSKLFCYQNITRSNILPWKFFREYFIYKSLEICTH